jgi:hypothetical protein
MNRTICLVVMSVIALGGCTSATVVRVKDGVTGNAIVGGRVKIGTVSRIYSFLDPRYYAGMSGTQPYRAEGISDATGRVVFRVPDHLGLMYVELDNRWVVRQPTSQWQPMLTIEEYKEEYKKTKKDGDMTLPPDRPCVRIENK